MKQRYNVCMCDTLSTTELGSYVFWGIKQVSDMLMLEKSSSMQHLCGVQHWEH